MSRGKGKKALYEKYEKCEAVQTALRKSPRAVSEKYAEKNKCEHDRVDYKTVRSLAKRMVGVVEHLAKACSSLEERNKVSEESLMGFLHTAQKIMSDQDEQIKKLQKRLEVFRHVN